MKRLLLVAVAATVVLLALPGPALGATFSVPSAPYPTIQAGIDAANAGDTVLVAPGTYNTSIILKDGVIVQGAGAPVCTIYYDGAAQAVYAGTSVTTAARIDGFTILGCYAYSLSIAIVCDGSPTITNNVISHFTQGVRINNSSPVVTNNTIIWNWYGIWLNACSPIVTNNIIAWGNIGFNGGDDSSPVEDYNDVWANSLWNYAGMGPGPHDIGAEPGVVDQVSDLHLQPTSPCIDAGSNAAPGLPLTDFEGESRVRDGNGDGTATVDIGADEYAPPYSWGGFLSPLRASDRRIFAGGVMVPVKFKLLHPGTPAVTDLEATLTVSDPPGRFCFTGDFTHVASGDYYLCNFITPLCWLTGPLTITVRFDEEEHSVSVYPRLAARRRW